MYGKKINIDILSFDRVRDRFGESSDMLLKILTRFKHHYNDEYCNDISVRIHDGEKVYDLD